MTALRRLRIALNALCAVAAGAALYVWWVGPIRFAPILRPIRWEEARRPALLAAALLALGLLIGLVESLLRGRSAAALRRVRRACGLLLLALAAAGSIGWLASRASRRGAEVSRADAARHEGAAQIGLATRPVLDEAALREGVPLPEASGGLRLEIACGLPEGAGPGRPGPAGVEGLLQIGPAGAGPDGPGTRQVGSCEPRAGDWRETRIEIPRVDADSRLYLKARAGVARSARLAQWSRPRVLAPSEDRPNLLLISLDTLRADHLGAYGYRRPVSPRIDALAREGTLFERATSQSPWTTPSHMSLFTSLYPSVHAVDSPTSVRQRRLGPERVTLAEILGEAGYATAAFTGSGSISATYGFWQGFDLYDETDKDDPRRAGEDISGVFEKASRWIVGHRDVPFFVFFHSYEVHAPYVHATFEADLPAAAPEADRIAALYDGDILHADAFVGQLVSLLDGLQLRRRTLIALVSDHGEEMGPRYAGRRFGHGHTLYDELLHVPLILSWPGRVPEGLRVSQRVQLIDVMPTVLELLGLPKAAGVQGVSLAGALAGNAILSRPAFAEAVNYGPERKAIIDGALKYIRLFDRLEPPAREIPEAIPAEELFDLSEDPREVRSLASSRAADVARLRRSLDELVSLNANLRRAGPEHSLDEETLRRLKALGYIQ